MIRRARWAVFISGTGSNMNALIEVPMDVDIACVVSSKASAPGLKKARRAGIPTVVMKAGRAGWAEVTPTLRAHKVDMIFLCGFMRILPPEFISDWEKRVINVHPSLLPQYPGLESIRRAFDDEAPIGVTVHEVVAEVDAGPRLCQKTVARGLDLERTEFMVHVTEHLLVRGVASQWSLA